MSIEHTEFNANYWDNRYKTKAIAWDLGQVSPPLKAYFDQLQNKTSRIVIPGGGQAHEAEYLHRNGFKNVYVVDVSETALANFKQRVPSFPEHHLIHQDFFSLNETFDIMIEQTFFCAIHPDLRANYVSQVHNILANQGKLVGLLFNAPLNDDQPPFGGSNTEYEALFSAYFDIQIMAPCYNSIESRAGRELFIKMIKK